MPRLNPNSEEARRMNREYQTRRRSQLLALRECVRCRKPIDNTRSKWCCTACLDFANQQYHARK